MSSAPTARIRFLGVAGYEIITAKGEHIFIDPFLDENPGAPFKSHEIERADLILVSHAAWDHMGDTEKIARRTGAPVVCGADVKAYLLAKGIPETQVRATIWGIALEVAGFRIQPVECHHWSQIKMPSGELVTGVPLGFVVYVEPDLRFYHYGDSAIFSDLKLIGELYKPNVGCVGIANPQELLPMIKAPGKMLTAEMSAREGVLAGQWLGLDVVLPCHYITPDDADVRAFTAQVEQARARGEKVPQSIVMKAGDILSWPMETTQKISAREAGGVGVKSPSA
jgi:L-ascorbate metabolism protein UlaG (beta-lactamase superfamily)